MMDPPVSHGCGARASGPHRGVRNLHRQEESLRGCGDQPVGALGSAEIAGALFRANGVQASATL